MSRYNSPDRDVVNRDYILKLYVGVFFRRVRGTFVSYSSVRSVHHCDFQPLFDLKDKKDDEADINSS